MSAYRQAILAVPAERLEQFSMEMEKNLDSNEKTTKVKPSKHHKSSKSSSKTKKSSKTDKKSSSGKKSSSDAKKRRSKAKNAKPKIRKRKNHSEDEGHLSGESDVEPDGLNLDKDLHPLLFYAKDRKLLMDQVFQIVKGAKFTAMLPDILKNVPEDVLKQKCLAQLEVMSSKRINHVLAGETMESSSGTNSSSDEGGNEAVAKVASSAKTSSNPPSLQTNFVDSTTPLGSEVLSLLAEGSEKSSTQAAAAAANSPPVSESDEEMSSAHEEGEVCSDVEEITVVEEEEYEPSEEEEEIVEVVEDEEYQEMVDEMLEQSMPNTSKNIPESQRKVDKESEKSQLELLELQLRERAIKSLMRAAGKLNQ